MVEQENEMAAKALAESVKAIEETTSEIMSVLFKHPVPISALGCMQALFAFSGVKGNSDSIESVSEELNIISKDLQLLSRVYAILEDKKPDFNKLKTLSEFNIALSGKTKEDDFLCVEVDGNEIKFKLTPSLSLPSLSHPTVKQWCLAL